MENGYQRAPNGHAVHVLICSGCKCTRYSMLLRGRDRITGRTLFWFSSLIRNYNLLKSSRTLGYSFKVLLKMGINMFLFFAVGFKLRKLSIIVGYHLDWVYRLGGKINIQTN